MSINIFQYCVEYVFVIINFLQLYSPNYFLAMAHFN